MFRKKKKVNNTIIVNGQKIDAAGKNIKISNQGVFVDGHKVADTINSNNINIVINN